MPGRLWRAPAACALVPLLSTALIVGPAQATGAEPAEAPPAKPDSAALRPGAIELGLSGSLVAVEGSVRSTLALRAGTFMGATAGLAGFEIEAQVHHQRSLDAIDLQGSLAWLRAAGHTVYPFVAVGGGVRQERIGSFSQARYPVGLGLGLRLVAGERAAVRCEYRFRRVLGDPVADFTEHQVLTGLSLLLRNHRRRASPGH